MNDEESNVVRNNGYSMNAELIVIDLYSVVHGLRGAGGSKMTGTPIPGLVDYVKAEQARGSTVFFIAGAAHEPWFRQQVERMLEGFGIRAVFVTHGLPDGFTLFISRHAFRLDEHLPVST